MSINSPQQLAGCRAVDPRETGLIVDGLLPLQTSTPETVEDMGTLVGLANREGLVVIPRGGGTAMGLGFPPAAADVLVETTALKVVIEYEPADLTLTIQAGARLGDVQRMLAAEGQFLALDPPNAEVATLGGIIATNASGPLRAAYGAARDLVIGTRVVNADGVATRCGGRVVKNVAGYDLNKLYIGSLGTVGIVVELSFKLWPLPPGETTLVAIFEGTALEKTLAALVRSPITPLSIEVLDRSASTGCLDVEPGATRWTLAVRLGGTERSLARQVSDVERMCREAGATDAQVLDVDPGRWARIADHASVGGENVLLRMAVPLSHTVAALTKLEALAARAGLDASLQGRAANGVVYAVLASSVGWEGKAVTSISDLVREGRAWATSLGGSLVVEASPAVLKSSVDVWGDVGASLKVMRALKQQLDPKGTLNRGRYVDRL